MKICICLFQICEFFLCNFLSLLLLLIYLFICFLHHNTFASISHSQNYSTRPLTLLSQSQYLSIQVVRFFKFNVGVPQCSHTLFRFFGQRVDG